jgi:histidine triad (HIT) family protein
MSSCIFCRVIEGSLPSRRVYEDQRLVAFHDVNPKAPLHVLVVPREHISTVNDLGAQHDALVGEMIRRAGLIAAEHGYGDRGYRTVLNCNGDAGQSVFHIHLHLLAGRRLTWPPG